MSAEIGTSYSVAELYARRRESEFTAQQQVTWNIGPPEGLRAEELMVSTGGLRLLHGINGIAHSINPDGTAVAGFAFPWHRNRAVRTHPFYSDVYDPDTAPLAQQIRATHEVDRDDLIRSVRNNIRSGMTNEEAWAKSLDPLVINAIIRAGRYNLLQREDVSLPMGSVEAMFWGVAIVDAIVKRDPSFLVGGVLCLETYRAALRIANAFKHTFGSVFPKEHRWSLFLNSNFQLDRYIAMRALASGMILVRASK